MCFMVEFVLNSADIFQVQIFQHCQNKRIPEKVFVYNRDVCNQTGRHLKWLNPVLEYQIYTTYFVDL